MLSENLKKIREKKGLSKMKLAKLSGISRRNIMLIETGRRKNPSIETVKALSNALNVSIEELIK